MALIIIVVALAWFATFFIRSINLPSAILWALFVFWLSGGFSTPWEDARAAYILAPLLLVLTGKFAFRERYYTVIPPEQQARGPASRRP